ncbi:hypothetical protein CEUSTIGMA_g2296.t1 [Chlamydomonas eustigma]|uniref:Uncharacterized protein n=1 Tax=Chlamydomonas eustigma TaxID=1157962 RepID=A0A250WWE4_9CHLO|nr:hypothetical protein CEUSTIGMA_g2296.t1 [Chlamydomonas eustigma]|eukprot:GAX74850.1 hypothetical protein CEUSTIGMA_g2296.t1 [Chlamydomonas eustigma]
MLDGDESSGDPTRNAYNFNIIHRRRDNRRITCIAVDDFTKNIFLGLSGGQVEEHQLLPPPDDIQHRASATTPNHALLKLVSERRFSRHAISEICCLPAAVCIAARTEDGMVFVAAHESANLQALPGVRSNAVAMAGDAAKSPSRLAVAVKSSVNPGLALAKAAVEGQRRLSGPGTGSTASRSEVPLSSAQRKAPATVASAPSNAISYSCNLLVYAVASGPGGTSQGGQPAQLLAKVALSEPVLAMAWVGDGILAAVPGGYKLVQSGSKISDVATGLSNETMVTSCTPKKQALLLFSDNLLLLVDSQGMATQQPFLLPEHPLAITIAGAFVVVATDLELLIFDASSAMLIQRISFAHDDAWVAAARRLPCAYDQGSKSILVATSSMLACLSPVEEERQVWELLRVRRYPQAISLALSCLRKSSQVVAGEGIPPAAYPWAGPALAQAGLLLLYEMRTAEAMEVFEACPVSAWQPAQLLPLYPEVATRWLEGLPSPMAYWGLHGPATLLSLQQICGRYMEERFKTGVSEHLEGSEVQNDHLDTVRGRTEDLLRRANLDIAKYILKVRGNLGVSCLQALDSLVMNLLCKGQEAGLLEGFVNPLLADSRVVSREGETAPRTALQDIHNTPPIVASSGSQLASQSVLRESVDLLQAHGRWHALALLRAARNHLAEALDIWKGMALGELKESIASTGAVAIASGNVQFVATSYAVMALLNGRHPHTSTPATFPPPYFSVPLVLSHLPWLLQHGPQQAQRLLKGLSDVLPVYSVLKLLRGRRDDVRWEYLQCVVWQCKEDIVEDVHELHTELGVELVRCIQGQHAGWEPDPVDACTPSSSSSSSTRNHVPQSTSRSQLHNSQEKDGNTSMAIQLHNSQEKDGNTVTLKALGDQSKEVDRDVESPHGVSPTLTFWAAVDATLDALESFLTQEEEIRRRQPKQLLQGNDVFLGAKGNMSSIHSRDMKMKTREKQLFKVKDGEYAALPPEALIQAIRHHEDSSESSCEAGDSSKLPRILRLHAALLLHLYQSRKYNPGSVMQIILSNLEQSGTVSASHVGPQAPGLLPSSTSSAGSGSRSDAGFIVMSRQFLRERVRLSSCLGDHSSALRILALQRADMEACIIYCRRQQQQQQLLNSEGPVGNGALSSYQRGNMHTSDVTQPLSNDNAWLVLLELLLSPGNSQQPMYSEAVRVLHEEGGCLDPLKVIEAVPDAVPLHVAAQTLTAMLAGSMHRGRHAQVLRGLHRSHNLAHRAVLAQLSSQRLLVSEESACHGCHNLLMDKVVSGYPSGMVLCGRCARPEQQH